MGRETSEKLGEIERNLTTLDIQELKRMERCIDRDISIMENERITDEEIGTRLSKLINDISQEKKSTLKEKFLKIVAYLNSGNRRGIKFIYRSYDGKVKGEIREVITLGV